MDSILLVISKPEIDRLGTEQAWKSVTPSLQQLATRAKGVITLYENCWLISAEENGLLFFDHAITVTANAKLHCRICLLKRHCHEFVHRPLNHGLRRLSAAIVRIFQGATGLVQTTGGGAWFGPLMKAPSSAKPAARHPA